MIIQKPPKVKKAYWFGFNPKEQTHIVQLLPPVVRGAYFSLMMFYLSNDKVLPNDDDALSIICGFQKKEWLKVKDKLIPKIFYIRTDDNRPEHLANEILDGMYDDANRHLSSKREAGKKGGEKTQERKRQAKDVEQIP